MCDQSLEIHAWFGLLLAAVLAKPAKRWERRENKFRTVKRYGYYGNIQLLTMAAFWHRMGQPLRRIARKQRTESSCADQTTANAQNKPALAESALADCHHIPISPDVYLSQPSITQCSVPISVPPCLHWTRDAPFPVHSTYHWPTLWLPLPSNTSPPPRNSLQISGRSGGPIERRPQRVLDRQAHQAAHCCSS